MFANLEAEQSRARMTDETVSRLLGMSRPTYTEKKKRGSFKVRECFMLCKLFGCTFEYLFKADQEA